MSRVITVYNAKGGVGKTTTAMNLGAYLALFGKKTLLIDFDSQFNATVGLGIKHEPDETIYHMLLAGQTPERAIKQTSLANFEIIPASSDLAGALIELIEVPDRESRLKNIIDQFKHNYDFVLIDLGPSLNLLSINGLLAADEVIIPIQCEYYSLEGLSQLLQTIDLIHNNLNHPLKIAGALLTMYDKREKLSREVAREVRKRFPYNVYDIEIPRSVNLAEAPSFQRPIVLYSPQSPGATAYERLAREVVEQKNFDKQEFPRQDFFQEEPLKAEPLNKTTPVQEILEREIPIKKEIPQEEQIVPPAIFHDANDDFHRFIAGL